MFPTGSSPESPVRFSFEGSPSQLAAMLRGLVSTPPPSDSEPGPAFIDPVDPRGAPEPTPISPSRDQAPSESDNAEVDGAVVSAGVQPLQSWESVGASPDPEDDAFIFDDNDDDEDEEDEIVNPSADSLGRTPADDGGVSVAE